MKVDKVTIRLAETIPTKQFANVRPEVEISITSEGETFDALLDGAKQRAVYAFDVVKNLMLNPTYPHQNTNRNVGVVSVNIDDDIPY